jgi:threonylcarbamoyladenosine tRNA methylthiotransferase MtaB
VPSFLVQTLGCKLNQLESEAITDAFLKSGFDLKNETFPSVIVINTCTVTSKADQKARRVIRKALRDYPDSCVIVTGCYAQLNREDICELETDDKKRLFVFNGSDKESILNLPSFLRDRNDIHDALKNLPENETDNDERKTASELRAFQFSPERFFDHTRSFLKIQDGCDKHCTYCRIRLARGPSISLDASEVLARLKMLEKKYSEAVITGVNISQYLDKVRNINLTSLLENLLVGTEKIALRL